MALFVIGDEMTVMGLNLVGIAGEVVDSEEQAREAVHRLMQDDRLEILFVTESWAARIREQVDSLKVSARRPILVEIPEPEPVQPATPIRELVRKAIGLRLGE